MGAAVVEPGEATISFDGNGNVNGGTITDYTSSGPCSGTLSGTYTVSSTGAVQATVTLNTGNSGCAGSTAQYSGEVNQTGSSAVFAESDGTASGGGFFSGTLIKQ